MANESVEKNLLSGNGFTMTVEGIPNTVFWLSRITVPGLTLGTAPIATNVDINYTEPGDKVLLDDLIIGFSLDENMNNWIELWNWTRDAAKKKNVYRDITIHTLTNKKNFNRRMVFKHAYPYNLSGISLDYSLAPDTPVQGDATFKFVDVEIS